MKQQSISSHFKHKKANSPDDFTLDSYPNTAVAPSKDPFIKPQSLLSSFSKTTHNLMKKSIGLKPPSANQENLISTLTTNVATT